MSNDALEVCRMVRELGPQLAQLLDGFKDEGPWSTWDQSVRDKLTTLMIMTRDAADSEIFADMQSLENIEACYAERGQFSQDNYHWFVEALKRAWGHTGTRAQAMERMISLGQGIEAGTELPELTPGPGDKLTESMLSACEEEVERLRAVIEAATTVNKRLTGALSLLGPRHGANWEFVMHAQCEQNEFEQALKARSTP